MFSSAIPLPQRRGIDRDQWIDQGVDPLARHLNQADLGAVLILTHELGIECKPADLIHRAAQRVQPLGIGNHIRFWLCQAAHAKSS